MGFLVGDGTVVRSWLDDWVAMGPFCELFPKLFRLAVNKESPVSDCFEVRSGCMAWEVSFRRSLRQMEGFMYQEMLSVFANMLFCRDYNDSRIWKPSTSREFSAKAFYSALEGTHPHRTLSSLVWLGLAPPRVEAFCWLAVASKVSTVDNLRRRGLASNNISDTCVMCGKEGLAIHMFLQCELAVSIWSNFIGRSGLAWCFPKNIADMVESWQGECFVGCGQVLCRMIPFAILWTIWKESNDMIFRGFCT